MGDMKNTGLGCKRGEILRVPPKHWIWRNSCHKEQMLELTATATCSHKHQIFIVGGWCYYTEGGRTTMASDESGRQMTGRHSSKINESDL